MSGAPLKKRMRRISNHKTNPEMNKMHPFLGSLQIVQAPYPKNLDGMMASFILPTGYLTWLSKMAHI